MYAIGLAVYLLLPSVALSAVMPPRLLGDAAQSPLMSASSRKSHKVPVTLGVMSRCPDALFCEQVVDNALSSLGFDLADVTLDFIARLNISEPEYGVTCKHGPQECAGNIHELCVAKHTQNRLATWWPWLQCVNMGGPEKIGTLEQAIQCALMSGIDWIEEGIRTCVRGEEGVDLLKESMERAVLLGITKSCTIMVSGKIWCIHDGEWKDCVGGHGSEDLAKVISDEWNRLNSEQAT